MGKFSDASTPDAFLSFFESLSSDQSDRSLPASGLSEQPLPASIGIYPIVATIDGGNGSTAVMLQGRHPLLEMDVAIKLLWPESRANSIDDLRSSVWLREARLGASFDHHACLHVFDAGYETRTRRPYFVMRFVPGGLTLDRVPCLMERRKSISLETSLRKFCADMAPLAEALSFLHRNGIWHHDLHPSNVLACVDESDTSRLQRIFLIDFGGASHRLSNRGISSGTPTQYPGFWPPWLNAKPDDEEKCTQLELYQFGVLLLYAGWGEAVVKGSLTPSTYPDMPAWRGPKNVDVLKLAESQGGGHCTPEMRGIIYALTAEKREHRYSSAEELHQDLISVAQCRLPVTKRGRKYVWPTREITVWRQFSKRSFWTVCLTSAFLVAALFGIGIFQKRYENEREAKIDEQTRRMQQDVVTVIQGASRYLQDRKTDGVIESLKKYDTGNLGYRSHATDFARRWIGRETDLIVGELHGHTDAVIRLHTVEDGRLLFSAGRDHKVIVWDLLTHSRRQEIDVRQYGNPCDLSATSDGRLLAVRTENGALLIVNTTVANPMDSAIQLRQHSDLSSPLWKAGGSRVAINREGTMVAWTDAEGFAWIAGIAESTTTLENIRQLSSAPEFTSAFVGGLTFSQDNRFLALAGDRLMASWNLDTGVVQRIDREVSINGNSRPCRLGRGDFFVATHGIGRELAQIDFANLSGFKRLQIPIHSGLMAQAGTIAASSNNQIAVSTNLKNAAVFDLDGKVAWTMSGVPFSVADIALSYNGDALMWTAGKDIHWSQLPSAKPNSLNPMSHFGAATSSNHRFSQAFALSDHGHWLAVCADAHTIEFERLSPFKATGDKAADKRQSVRCDPAHGDIVSLRFSPQGELFIALHSRNADEKSAIIIAVAALQKSGNWLFRNLARIEINQSPHVASKNLPVLLQFSATAEWLAIANLYSAAEVELIKTRTGERVRVLGPDLKGTNVIENATPIEPDIVVIEFDPTGKQLFYARNEGRSWIFDMTAAQLRRVEIATSGGVASAAFSDDGRYLALASPGAIRLLDSSSSKVLDTFFSAGDVVTSLAFLPNADGFLAGTASGDLIVWDVRARRELTKRPLVAEHEKRGRVSAIRHCRAANCLITRLDDLHLRVWDLREASVPTFVNW